MNTIPPWRVEVVANHRDHQEISNEQSTSDTMIFTEVHLISGKLVLVVAIHPLDVSQAIGRCQILRWELARSTHKMGIHKLRSSLELAFANHPRGMPQDPSQSTGCGLEQSPIELNTSRCSKPSSVTGITQE